MAKAFIYHEDGKFRVDEEAAEYLNSLDEPIGEFFPAPLRATIPNEWKFVLGLVVVAGRYRSGKSFLLNQMVDDDSAFKVGHTVQSCTQGIALVAVKHQQPYTEIWVAQAFGFPVIP